VEGQPALRFRQGLAGFEQGSEARRLGGDHLADVARRRTTRAAFSA
jgi:hypothetical protein